MHIETGYPDIDGRWYHRFRQLTEHAGGFDVNRDVLKDHGPLATLYTTPKEGDSWTFVYLIPTGLSDPNEPTWGGWAGRYGPRDGDPLNKEGPSGPQFFWANQQDTFNGATSRDNTASRWAEHLQNDFRARLDWCVVKDFADANHAPIVHCLNDKTQDVLRVSATAGIKVTLDASGTTDPDGDQLSYRWFVYSEPGTYRREAVVQDGTELKATIEVPTSARGKSLHIILQVTDNGQLSVAVFVEPIKNWASRVFIISIRSRTSVFVSTPSPFTSSRRKTATLRFPRSVQSFGNILLSVDSPGTMPGLLWQAGSRHYDSGAGYAL